MNPYFEKLKAQLEENPPNLDDSDSVLALLYETYNEINSMDDDRIKADFHALYETMNGMSLQEMDRIIYPVSRAATQNSRLPFLMRKNQNNKQPRRSRKDCRGCGFEKIVTHRRENGEKNVTTHLTNSKNNVTVTVL